MAFSHTTLKKVILPEGIIKIGVGAFKDCRSLKQVQLSEGLEEIGNSAFESCYNLMEIKLPSTVKKLEKKYFLIVLN